MGHREFLGRFPEGEDRILAARVLDKLEWTAQHNAISHTMFLSPHERDVAEMVLSSAGHPRHMIAGGHSLAERNMILFLPDYLAEENIEADDLPFGAVRVTWGRENHLTHRDILGSLMALGVKREALGDLLVGESSCDVLVLRDCLPFLLTNWEGAGRIGLHPQEIPLDAIAAPVLDGEELRDTVATLRLDAVLGSGFSLSRSQAAALITSGKVSQNGRECVKPDRQVAPGDTLSVRGYGRLIIKEAGGLSKKGRIRITMEKFG